MLGLIGTAAAENQQWWPIRNDSGEEVPAFACMRITGMFSPFTSSDGVYQRVGVANMGFTIGKPNAFASQYSHLFNGPIAIASGAVGQGVFGHVMLGRRSGVSAPTVGSAIGPTNGSWDLAGGSYGFTVVADTSLDDTLNLYDGGITKVVRVIQSPALFLRGTAIDTLGTGLVEIDTGPYQVTATYNGTPSISPGGQVLLHWLHGTWYASKP